MKTRRPTRSPVEIANAIGEHAFDLHAYGDRAARAALMVIAEVNPDVVWWLRDRLIDITKQPELPATEAQR